MIASSLPQLARNTNRFRYVITVLGKYGLARWLTGVPIPWVNQLLHDNEGHQIADLTVEESLRGAVSELGTTFIKLGQILSTRADLIGVDLANELSRLRADVNPEPVEAVLETIEQDLGRPVAELFASFDHQPLASASIAQVHRAILHDGREVVVKVQRQNIRKQIETDLDIMARIAELAERYSRQLQHYQPVATAAKFRKTLLRELDFSRELQNMVEFNRNFQNDPRTRFATPIPDRSTSRVLTMEFLDGPNISNTHALVNAGHTPAEIADRGAKVFLDMVFRDSFYHADPHPGNLLVLESGEIGVLDCGMVGRIEESTRDQIEDMLLAVAGGDAHRLTRTLIQLGSIPPNFDDTVLESDVEEFIAEYATRKLSELNLSRALTEMVELIRRHEITLPASIMLLLKVLIMLEGTSKSLDPSFSLAQLIAPYQRQVLFRRYSPSRIHRKTQAYFQEWSELLKILPSDAADILDRVKRGKFDVHLDHRRLDSIVNRLVSGVLTAALFMGSSALWSQQVPPLLFGASVPGFVGCALAFAMGMKIFRAIRHSGRLDQTR